MVKNNANSAKNAAPLMNLSQHQVSSASLVFISFQCQKRGLKNKNKGTTSSGFNPHGRRRGLLPRKTELRLWSLLLCYFWRGEKCRFMLLMRYPETRAKYIWKLPQDGTMSVQTALNGFGYMPILTTRQQRVQRVITELKVRKSLTMGEI